VTPVYNESENIPLFYAELLKVARTLEHEFELIFVDDGSSDDSVKVVESLAAEIKQVENFGIKLIELSRNFGKEIATTAGIEAARGDAVIILDADLQHPITAIPQFINKWEKGYDVVVGVRSTDGHYSLLKKAGSELFYKIMNRISETKIVPHSTDFRLLDRKVVEAFRHFTERQRITRGLIDWLGFKRGYVHFETGERLHGQPSYSTRKLVKLALNSFTAHSLFPLRIAGYVGIIFMLIFGVLGLFTYIEVYLLNDPMGLHITGTAVLGLLMLFAIGILLACLGLIAIYIASIHGEVINRPLYVVRQNKEL
jgi:glycosyltransferase involved in cell wall biosynthesis